MEVAVEVTVIFPLSYIEERNRPLLQYAGVFDVCFNRYRSAGAACMSASL